MLNSVLNKFVLLTAFVFIFIQTSIAQKGDYFVTNFKIESERIDHPYFDLDHIDNSYIYVAHRSGVLIFDGYRWERVNCNNAVYSIAVDGDEILVGGKMGFGTIKLNNSNTYQYFQISDSTKRSQNIY